MWGERKEVISSDFHVIGRCCLFRYILLFTVPYNSPVFLRGISQMRLNVFPEKGYVRKIQIFRDFLDRFFGVFQ